MIEVVNVFTRDGSGGNPAGVIQVEAFPHVSEMTAAAAKLGYSESAYVCNKQVRFFSPKQEVPFCAHALIAVAEICGSGTYQTDIGEITVTKERDLFEMKQQDPMYCQDGVDEVSLQLALGIVQESIGPIPPAIVSTGVPKLLINLSSVDALQSLTPDMEQVKKLCEKTPARGVYVFVQTEGVIHARQFNPRAGIDEDPATGVAAGALLGYLHKMNGLTKVIIHQGDAMGLPCTLYARIENGIRVGGKVRRVENTTEN